MWQNVYKKMDGTEWESETGWSTREMALYVEERIDNRMNGAWEN
jgi:hypothetical protein